MSSHISTIESRVTFISMVDCSKGIVDKVVNSVCKNLEPFYGKQDPLVQDIRERKLHKTEVLKDEDNEVGFITYLRKSQNVQMNRGENKYLEVTSFGLFDDSIYDRPTYGNKMVERINEIAKEILVDKIGMKVVVTNQSCVSFLMQYGFQIHSVQSDFPQPGTREALLIKDLAAKEETISGKRKSVQEGQERKEVSRGFSSSSTSNPEKRMTPSRVVPSQLHEAKEHVLPLRGQYLEMIRSGKKTIEGRINTGGPARYRQGDKIRFVCRGLPDLVVTITKIEKFPSFKNMLETVGHAKCLPNVRSVEEGNSIYLGIPGYAGKSQQFGVLATHIQL